MEHESNMRSMPNLGGSGGMPPENFEKIKPSEIESEGSFNGVTSSTDSKTACILQSNNV